MSENGISGGESDVIEPSGPTAEPTGRGGTVDMLLRTLANPRRREVLYRLADAEESVPIDELAEHVAGVVEDGPQTPRAVERARVGLHHNHLPKLEEARIVSEENGFVSLDDAAPRALDCLAAATSDESR